MYVEEEEQYFAGIQSFGYNYTNSSFKRAANNVQYLIVHLFIYLTCIRNKLHKSNLTPFLNLR